MQSSSVMEKEVGLIVENIVNCLFGILFDYFIELVPLLL